MPTRQQNLKDERRDSLLSTGWRCLNGPVLQDGKMRKYIFPNNEIINYNSIKNNKKI